MAYVERLYDLRRISNEKCQEALNEWERHFVWLEEYLAAARQSFASDDLTIPPNTQINKNAKKRQQAAASREDDPDQVGRRTSVHSSDGDQEENTTITPPRRRRAASRLATQKVKQNLKQKINQKMRRPTTPEQTLITSVKEGKCEGTRQAIIERPEETENVSPETQVPLVKTKGSRLVEQLQTKAKGEPQVTAPSPSSSDAKTPKKASPNNSHCISVNLNRERLSRQAPGSTTPVVETEKVESCNTAHVEEDEKINTSDLSLRLEDSEECKSDVENELPTSRTEMKSNTEVEESLSVKDIPVPTPRVTRTKQKALQCPRPPAVTDSENKDPVSQPMAKPRSTWTKQRVTTMQDTMESQVPPPAFVPETRVTRTKLKNKELAQSTHPKEKAEMEGIDDISSAQLHDPPQNTRSTRTKKRLVEVTEEQLVVSSNTKRRKTDESSDLEEGLPVDKTNAASRKYSSPDTRKGRHSGSQGSVSSSGVSSVKSNASKTNVGCFTKAPQPQQAVHHRITRSKMHQAHNKSPVKASPRTRSPRTPTQERLNNIVFGTAKSPVLHCSGSQNSVSSSGASSVKSDASETNVGCFTKAPQPQQPLHRITRSKMHQAHNKGPVTAPPCTKSPTTPTQERFDNIVLGTPKSPVLYCTGRTGRSPLKFSPRPNTKCTGMGKGILPHLQAPVETVTEMEELTTDTVEVARSPARVIRHSAGRAVRDDKRQKGAATAMFSPQHTDKKGIGHLPHHLNSASSTYSGSSSTRPKTYSHLQPGSLTSSSSSAEVQKRKMISGMTNEVRRPANINTAVLSFIKVQPAKPTREELDEKRQQDLERKREKVEENRKKKEDLLRAKAEEKKRANEERMRRVQEAREERERKALEAKEQQDRERRQREERHREEQHRKKQQLLAKKKAEEEARTLKIKEQQEEEERKRREEEKRRQMEEERRLEELRRYEEERRARLAEHKRLQEEEKRRKAEEVERIAREKEELERLKQEEAQRKAASPARKAALNNTYIAGGDDKENQASNLNTTYTASKPAVERSDSYEMTPHGKNKNKKKASNANDYNIHDIQSDDSTDDESLPKKNIPAWAMNSQLNSALIQQEFYPPDLDKIFIPEELLKAPMLGEMFPIKRKRFFKRTSSAVWDTPPARSYH